MFLECRKTIELKHYAKYGVMLEKSGTLDLTMVYVRDESSHPFGELLPEPVIFVYAECKSWGWAKTYKQKDLLIINGEGNKSYPKTNEDLSMFLVTYEDEILQDLDKEIDLCIEQFV